MKNILIIWFSASYIFGTMFTVIILINGVMPFSFLKFDRESLLRTV